MVTTPDTAEFVPPDTAEFVPPDTAELAPPDTAELLTWSALERLARALRVDTVDLQTTLDAIVSLAVDTVDVASYAGLILIERRQLVPQSTIGRPPQTLDVLQQQLGTGPCFDTAVSQVATRIDDMSVDTRWPVFAERATELGVGSMLCVPLWVDETSLGTLSLYAGRTCAFDDRHLSLTRLYATLAALALADARRAANLHTALHNRDLIGQAKGILIERCRLTPDAAFRALSTASQTGNVKLTVIAQHLVDTGELLGTGGADARRSK